MNRGGWRSLGSLIAQWRHNAKQIGDLSPRLLKIVLQEMERDFTSLRNTNRSIYQVGSSYFWHEKKADFDRTAMKVIELNPDSPAIQLHTADYLWNGLRLHARAIDVLLRANTRGKLHEDGRRR